MKSSRRKNSRTKVLTGILPGAFDPQDGREVDKRLPQPYVETDPLKQTKHRTLPTPSPKLNQPKKN
jgi:hypothetical protein